MGLVAADSAVPVALIGLAGLFVSALAGIVVALIGRSTRAEARAASVDADEALELISRFARREADCLDALEVAMARTAVLEERLGLEPGEGPDALARARESQAAIVAELDKRRLLRQQRSA